MNPNAATLWPYPRWALAALLACLGTLGPFSIDAYLPAFPNIPTMEEVGIKGYQATRPEVFHGSKNNELQTA